MGGVQDNKTHVPVAWQCALSPCMGACHVACAQDVFYSCSRHGEQVDMHQHKLHKRTCGQRPSHPAAPQGTSNTRTRSCQARETAPCRVAASARVFGSAYWMCAMCTCVWLPGCCICPSYGLCARAPLHSAHPQPQAPTQVPTSRENFRSAVYMVRTVSQEHSCTDLRLW